MPDRFPPVLDAISSFYQWFKSEEGSYDRVKYGRKAFRYISPVTYAPGSSMVRNIKIGYEEDDVRKAFAGNAIGQKPFQEKRKRSGARNPFTGF
jgi:hypothetical protein